MHFASTRDAEQAGIEMIYQEISLNPELSVAENIFLGKLPRAAPAPGSSTGSGPTPWPGRRWPRSAWRWPPSQAVRLLSTSQQQMISIAKALYRRPRILVLDEPTSALTERETETLCGILQSLRVQGISCIYISHKLEEVFSIADRVTVLRDGRVRIHHPAGGGDGRRVVEDMVGRKIETMYPKVQDVPIGQEVLRVEDLHGAFAHPAARNIVEDVSFNLRAGEILGLGGPGGLGQERSW